MKIIPYKTFIAMLFAFAFTAAATGAQTESPAPMRTMIPNPAGSLTPAPATEAPTAAPAAAKPSFKKLKTASLPTSQLAYALTHQVQEAKLLAKMKKINFDNIRIVKLPSLMKLRYHVDAGATTVAMADPFIAVDAATRIAQATAAPLPSSNGNNSPIQYLHNVLANINVSNALNNLLNNSTVNANVSLSNVLNNNKIAIGQVVGIYIGGGSLINTIIK